MDVALLKGFDQRLNRIQAGFGLALAENGRGYAFINPYGSIKGSNGNLQGIDAASHVDKLSKKELAGLPFADRAELIRQLSSNKTLKRSQQVKMLLRLYKHFELPKAYVETMAETTKTFHDEASALIRQHEGTWTRISETEKKTVLEQIHKLQAERFGFAEAKLDYQDNFKNPEARYGYYKGDTETIHLVGQDLPTLKQAAWTLFHEGLHRRQHNMIYDIENSTSFDASDEKQQMALLFHLECINGEKGYISQNEDSDAKYVPSEREAAVIDSIFAKRVGLPPMIGRLQYQP